MTSASRHHRVSSAASPPLLVIRTLGHLSVEGASGRVRVFRRKERLLLAYLARVTRPVPRAELTALLWGHHPERRARQSLRQALFVLRQRLGDALEVGSESVRLNPGAVALDLTVLEAELAAGRPAAALEWWRGEFLAGLEDAGDEPLREWIDAERGSLHRLLTSAHAELAAAVRRAPAEATNVLPLLRRWAEANPADEAAQLQLIETLRGEGRLAEASAWHQRAAEQLQAACGREPSAAFVACERTLLRARLHVGPGDVGRGTAWTEMETTWREARSGGGGVVRLEGDGVRGFCDAFVAAAASVRPALVLRLGGMPPHTTAAWSSAARLLAPLRSARGLSGVADAALAEVACLLPAIRERYPNLPSPRGGDDALSAALIETLRDVAAEVPVLVCVADAGGCDDATRSWLFRLADELPPYVLLVLGEPAEPAVVRIGPSLRQRFGRRRLAIGTFAAALAALAIGVAGLLHGRGRAGGAPVLAVATVSAIGESEADPVAMALPELISTQLARIDPLQVISRRRMLELRAQAAGELAAATLAGATDLLEGELYRRDGRYRLELRRLDARTGRVRAVHVAEAEHAADLAHAIARAVARDLGREAPPMTQMPGSVAARALYEAGLQAFYHRQDFRAALRLFRDALEDDPDFAMAALFAARSAGIVEGYVAARPLLHAAEAAAGHAPERDRLFVLASTALHFSDPAGLEHARRLASLDAGDPAGPLMLGLFLSSAGRFDEAITELQRSLALEPPPPDAPNTFCSPCEAYATLIHVYWAVDSLDAAIRVAADWATKQPRSHEPLTSLATLQVLAGDHAAAAATRARAAKLMPVRAEDVLWSARSSAHRGDFAAADAGLEYLTVAGSADIAREALWLHFISLREQERWDEAWRTASRLRELMLADSPASHPYATPQAVLLMETGRARTAALLFDTMYHQLGDLGRGSRTARDAAWLLMLQATALAAAGDTARLGELADRIEGLGARTAYARDGRLHHHVRGLLLRARGDLAGAEHALRAAIYSTTAGYTRTNVELASVLLELGRADEAAALLHAALRAPLDGPALYVTRRELRQLLADAEAALAAASPPRVPSPLATRPRSP